MSSKIISSDKAKTQTYCDMAQLGDQLEQSGEKKDTKKTDEPARTASPLLPFLTWRGFWDFITWVRGD